MTSRFRLTVCASLVALASALAGCSRSSPPAAVQRLPGKWHGQMIVFEEELQGKLTPQQIAVLSQNQMDFEFKPDGSMVMTGSAGGQVDSSQAKWEMIKQEGDLLTIKSTEAGGKEKNIHLEFDGTDTFYMPVKTEVAELGAFRFTRLR
jgi:hypothetical protein